MKRGLVVNLFLLISSIFFIIILTGLVVAVHEAGHVEDVVLTKDVVQSEGVSVVPADNEKTVTEVVPEESGDIGGENDDDLKDITSDDVDRELGDGGVNSGIVHSFDLFLDGILSNDEEYSKERAAEIRTLVKEGNYEEAKKLIDLYTKHADIIEEEVSPDQNENVQRRSRIIRKAYGDIINDIPAEYKGSFNQIRVKERSIGTAAELVDTINKLCEKLGKLDPNEFARNCKISEDDPKWKKKLVKELTEEQEKEAREFGEIMSECFRTSGDSCNCERIIFPGMRDMCIDARPLAVECKNGDTDACEKLDSIEFPEMPDYLMEIMNEIEKKYAGDVIGEHMPRECVEKGATTPEECMRIMVEIRAPPECKNAILEAGATTEREAREICEPIMFKKNAPEQCVNAGILDPKKCAEFFEKDFRGREGPGVEIPNCEELKGRAAVECYNHAGEAADFSENYYKDRGEFRSREGENFDPNKFDKEFRKDNVDKYADLYKSRREGYQKYYNNEGDEKRRILETLDREEECVKQCASQGLPWTFVNGQCECLAAGDYEQPHQEYNRDQYQQYDDQQPGQYQQPPPGYQPDQGQYQYKGGEYPQGQYPQQPGQYPQPPITTSPPPTTTSPTTTTSPPPSGTTSPSPSSPPPSGTSPPPTGSVISGRAILENPFLKYYFG
ncbi:MAG: hypothetical protein AABY07_03020 [Nanoarchaeota archaeon]